MDTAILEDIGLTGAEIKVFLAMIDLGSASAGEIIRESGLQSGVVHRSFHTLSDKGLITYIMIGKNKQYQAIEPELLLTYIDEKRAKIESLLPELKARAINTKNKPQVTMYQGIRGTKELLHHMLDTDSKEYIAYGGNETNTKLYGDFFWENFHMIRRNKGINAKLIFHESIKHWKPILNKHELTEVRITKNIFEQMTETVICGNRVAILVYLPKPFGVLIDEKLAANSYKQFFEILWKQAE